MTKRYQRQLTNVRCKTETKSTNENKRDLVLKCTVMLYLFPDFFLIKVLWVFNGYHHDQPFIIIVVYPRFVLTCQKLKRISASKRSCQNVPEKRNYAKQRTPVCPLLSGGNVVSSIQHSIIQNDFITK
ncbi:hypothetical protein BD560DRAFT_428940 [Blakeslea trispora]|nr:hypothetical protein BD560DRAFT_428940 [Blakeslea trispora]